MRQYTAVPALAQSHTTTATAKRAAMEHAGLLE